MKVFIFTAIIAAIAFTTVTADPYTVNGVIKVANSVAFYEHINKTGKMVYLTGLTAGQCYDRSTIGTFFNDQVSSLDNFGNCAILFSGANCRGTVFKVGPASACKRSFTLNNCKFNDQMSSFKINTNVNECK